MPIPFAPNQPKANTSQVIVTHSPQPSVQASRPAITNAEKSSPPITPITPIQPFNNSTIQSTINQQRSTIPPSTINHQPLNSSNQHPAPPSSLVPLASLSPRPNTPRQDPKIPTQKNVNDLKNALAAVLSKDQDPRSKNQVNQNTQIPKDNSNSGSQSLNSLKGLKPISKIPPAGSTVTGQIQPLPPISPLQPVQTPTQKPYGNPPPEVPEEVLRKVLKVE